MKKAVILLSGGLDSTTCLAIAKNAGFEICALSFSYGQRHEIEIQAAKRIANSFEIKDHRIAEIDLRIFGQSSLTSKLSVPKDQNIADLKTIPSTYVPARNTIFLSYSLALAEVVGAFDIFIGVNSVDYSGYPDCRPEFIASFSDLANLACAAAVENKGKFTIHTPLLKMSKKEIIQTGLDLKVDYSLTHSCYDPVLTNGKVYSCGRCDSCQLRLEGFKEAAIEDPSEYVKHFG